MLKRLLSLSICLLVFILSPLSVFADEPVNPYDWDPNGDALPQYYSINTFIENEYDVNSLTIYNNSSFSASDVQAVNDCFLNPIALACTNSVINTAAQDLNFTSFCLIAADGQVLFIVGSDYGTNVAGASMNPDANTFSISNGTINTSSSVHGYCLTTIDYILDYEPQFVLLKAPPIFPTEAPWWYTEDYQREAYLESVDVTRQSWNSLLGSSTDLYITSLPSGTYSISDFISGTNVAVSSSEFSSYAMSSISDNTLSQARTAIDNSASPYYTLNAETQSKFNQILSYVSNIDIDFSDVLAAIEETNSWLESIYLDLFDSEDGAHLLVDIAGTLTNVLDRLNLTLSTIVNNITGSQGLGPGGGPPLSGGKSLKDIYNAISLGFNGLASYFGGLSFNFNANSFNLSETFKAALLDVHEQINNAVNPLSDDNFDDFNSVVSDIQDDTFIGSGLDMIDDVDSFVQSIGTESNTSDGHFSIQLLPTSFFGASIPASYIDINLSWYGRYRQQAFSILRAFILIGFMVLFVRRIPALIAGVPLESFFDRDVITEDLTVNDDGVLTSWSTTTRSGNTTTHQRHTL